MQCYFCHWRDSHHDENCPEMADVSQREAAMVAWGKGYDDGRNRRNAQSDDATYRVGWVRGDAAADYRENVFE